MLRDTITQSSIRAHRLSHMDAHTCPSCDVHNDHADTDPPIRHELRSRSGPPPSPAPPTGTDYRIDTGRTHGHTVTPTDTLGSPTWTHPSAQRAATRVASPTQQLSPDSRPYFDG